MDAMIINEYALHLEVGSFAVFLGRELDEGILQTISSLLISDDFATKNLAEAAEDEFEIFVSCYRVEFAYEQHLFWRSDIGEWQISNQLQCQSLSAGFPLSPQFFQRFGVCVLLNFLVPGNTHSR